MQRNDSGCFSNLFKLKTPIIETTSIKKTKGKTKLKLFTKLSSICYLKPIQLKPTSLKKTLSKKYGSNNYTFDNSLRLNPPQPSQQLKDANKDENIKYNSFQNSQHGSQMNNHSYPIKRLLFDTVRKNNYLTLQKSSCGSKSNYGAIQRSKKVPHYHSASKQQNKKTIYQPKYQLAQPIQVANQQNLPPYSEAILASQNQQNPNCSRVDEFHKILLRDSQQKNQNASEINHPNKNKKIKQKKNIQSLSRNAKTIISQYDASNMPQRYEESIIIFRGKASPNIQIETQRNLRSNQRFTLDYQQKQQANEVSYDQSSYARYSLQYLQQSSKKKPLQILDPQISSEDELSDIVAKTISKASLKKQNNLRIDNIEIVKIQYLGSGQTSYFYKCYLKPTNFLFTLQQIPKVSLITNTLSKKLQEKIQIESILCHPNIIEFYSCLETENNYYLCYQYGETNLLNKIHYELKSINDKIDYFKQIINAVFYLHQMGVAHGNLILSNILIIANTPKIKGFLYSFYKKFVLGSEMQKKFKQDCYSVGILGYSIFFGIDKNNLNSKMQDLNKLKLIQKEQKKYLCIDLILRLLQDNEMERLSMQEAFNHPLFTKF